jgi:hypothetical protein
MNKAARIVVLVFVIVIVAALGGFVAYSLSATAEPEPEALAAMDSDETVTVEEGEWIVFRPTSAEPRIGFVFYPGGYVDPRAYAPMAHDIAAAGNLAVIVPMPLNLAVLGSNRAEDVLAAFPEIDSWAIGGHSLGGAMAASYVTGHPVDAKGLVFWAAYPSKNTDLSGTQLDVASVSGTLDGLSTPDDIEASRPLLPANTVYTAIEGGNHAQFGWYGPQRGDNEATISHEEQQAQTVAATLQLLEQIVFQ